MPTLTVTKNYADGTTLTKAQLDAAYDSIATFLNTTKLDTNNLQTGAVDSNAIATGAVIGSKIAANAVTTTSITDGSITIAKIASGVVDGVTIQNTGTTLQVKDASITQAKLAVRASGTTVAAGGVAVSATCGAFTLSSSMTDVTSLSVTITTTGRPVYLMLQSDGVTYGSTVGGYLQNINGGQITFQCLRGASVIGTGFSAVGVASSTGFLPAAFQQVDAVAAGTYTYKIQAKVVSGAGATMTGYQLVAFEL